MKRLAVLLAVIAGCVAAATALATTGAPRGPPHTSLGTVLVNARGRTLYDLQGDSAKHLTCTGGCLSSWIPLSGPASATGSAKAADLGQAKRGSSTQVTYAGHPLYTFVGDTLAGDVSGEGIETAGKKWYAVSPSGAAMITTTKGSSTSTAGGGSTGW
jgi:predicted lipoprotein with Yx(FWY)xxD motif